MKGLLKDAKRVLSRYQDVNFETDERWILVSPQDPTRFEVALVDEGRESTLLFGNWHYPFENRQEVMSVLEDCLSGNARVREVSRLRVPTKAFWNSAKAIARPLSRGRPQGACEIGEDAGRCHCSMCRKVHGAAFFDPHHLGVISRG